MRRRTLAALTGGASSTALTVLFLLNLIEEAERDAFGILVPNIRKSFGLDVQNVLTVVALAALVGLAAEVPIAYLADRARRVRMMLGGLSLWSALSVTTAAVTGPVTLGFVRAGTSVGRAVIDPTHNSLLPDYYDVETRSRVFSAYRAGNAIGACLGPLAAGLIAYFWSWRVPFLIFGPLALLAVIAGLRLREPVRGRFERKAMGVAAEAVDTEETPPSFAEAWRTVWKIQSLRRIWFCLPFLAASIIGFASLAALLYAQAFGLGARGRGFVAAGVEPLAVIGLVVGASFGGKWLISDPGRVLRFIAVVSAFTSVFAVVFALAPWLGLAIAANACITAALAVVGPGILAALSLAIPPRCRSLGYSIASLWIIPGLILLPLIGWIADHWGIRAGMLLMTPVFLIGGLVLSSAGSLIKADIGQVWQASAAMAEVANERRKGGGKLLLVRGLNVSYNGVQVLFGVDFDIDTGQTVALLGTNGAGKSTLLRAIAGVVAPDRGAVVIDGRESTWAPANEVAQRGVVLFPGGAGVFPSLTVSENLDTAEWLVRSHRERYRSDRYRVLELFPALAPMAGRLAGTLSGGEQQMLALAMALISRPRLLMIDELSLGLAPIVVEELLGAVRSLKEEGITIVLVEQSVNLALTVAETAYFMEKGEIRFHGPTAELLERPDLLRSVFLPSASGAEPATGRPPAVDGSGPATSPSVETRAVRCSFGGIAALAGVDVDVRPGEILGIIGPNGAGKTTLFDVITGYTRPDSGRVLLGGEDVTSFSPARRARMGLGRSFQDGRLFPAMTVADNIAVALERWTTVRDPFRPALRLPSAYDAEQSTRRRVDELLAVLGLGTYRDKFVRELSTGTRRVVDLACLLAHRPTVILLDEPSSGIAQREAEALVPLLLRIRAETGASLVVIEHDMALVTGVADRLVAMDRGNVIASGDCAAVLQDPAVVESYLGGGTALARSGPRRNAGATEQ